MKKLNTDSNTRTIGLDKTQFKEHIMSIKEKVKVAGFASTITALVCASVPVSYASDIEIYKVPEDAVGSTTLMMMLDTSGSMSEKDGGTTTRMQRLQKGLKDALQGTSSVPRIEDKVVMGLSTFSSYRGYIRIPAKALGTITGTAQDGNYIKPRWKRFTLRTKVGNKTTDTVYYNTCTAWNSDNYNCLTWSGDTTTVPTGFSTSSPFKNDTNTSCTDGNRNNCVFSWELIPKYKDVTHRDNLVSIINGLSPSGNTPTAYAYADAAAYLMGSTTTLPALTVNVPVYARYSTNPNTGWTCKSWNISSKSCADWGNYSDSGFNVAGGSTSSKSCKVSNYNATCFYYDKNFDDPDYVNSGFESSVSESKNGDIYAAPESISSQFNNPAKKECSGQGIYFLTDGEPNPSGGVGVSANGLSGTTFKLMKQALSTSGNSFNCANSELGKRPPYFNKTQNDWTCIGNFAESLLNPLKNPVGLQLKTVVVGFGSDFSGTGNNDVEDAKDWGNLGGGGWVQGTSSEDIVKSINKFIQDLNKDIPSMSTGSSTIPVDSLNPAALQPYSYFPQFEPKVKPEDSQQVWFGNLKKYYVLNNGVYASQTASDSSVVVKQSKLQDLSDIWAKGGVTYPEGTAIFKKDGALSQLPVGVSTTGSVNTTARNLFTDYSYDGTKEESERVGRDFDLVQVKYDYTTDVKTKDDTTYARAFMGLLGYNIANDSDTNGVDFSGQTASIRQMGAIMHSNPILLTQEGKAVAEKNATTGKISVSSTDRSDYVLFGTTQGLVQVVDANTGVEKFAFAPKEIVERQSETFKNNGGSLVGGKNALYYGMDGEWSAHTVYVTKSDGTLTVKGTARNVADSEEKENLSGKQWVYGGMRMGGRSYYSLDLTDIDSPKLKFHIDPSSGKVYSKANPEGKSFAAISNMGQSWSKPTLGYVNWKGKRKLVMFVGGGYDAGGDNGDGLYSNNIRTGYAGYENYNYKQENSTATNKKIGAGVYMFDADNGDLLWNADSDTNGSLKYSVASPIRTVDRNNDGIIDHLYFGDLAGQGFRVDFKNDGSKTAFSAQATKVLDLHQTNGTSPRFYTLPVFTAHRSAGKTEGGNIVIATFVSGNKSSPLLASSDATEKQNSVGLQYDGAYAIYDYDIYPNDSYYPTSNMAARGIAAPGAAASVSTLKYINPDVDAAVTGAQINKTSGWGGWYYLFKKKFNNAEAGASIIKALTTPIAMEGSLYVTQFDSSDNGTTSSCGAGVKGNSFAEQLCLPTGVCKTDAKYRYNLGSGIVTLNVGGDDGDPYKRSLVVPDPEDVGDGCVGTACTTGKKFLTTGGALKFIPHRWYEKYASNNP